MDPEFAPLLRDLVARNYESLRAFAREAGKRSGHEETETAAYASKVISGQKPPPLARIESWATALHLDGEERKRFIEAAEVAYLARVPDAVDRLIRERDRALEDAGRENTELRERLAAALARIDRLESDHAHPADDSSGQSDIEGGR